MATKVTKTPVKKITSKIAKAVRKPAVSKAVKTVAKETAKTPGKRTARSVVTKKETKTVISKTLESTTGKLVKTSSTVSAQVFDTKGEATSKISLRGDVFGAPTNPRLVATAVRVYLANQRKGHASTKTRGEVAGSTRKLYKQKGTGRARHGSIKAPIYVGGGITFGPRPRDYSLSLPKAMGRKAVSCILSDKLRSKQLFIVDGLTSLKPKTKLYAKLLSVVTSSSKSVLFVTSSDHTEAVRAARNISDITVIRASDVHTYAVWAHKTVVLEKPAVSELEHRLQKDHA